MSEKGPLKKELLEDLFRRWVFETGAVRSRFHEDGIFDEEAYAAADPKLLFVAREPNRTGAQVFDTAARNRSHIHLESATRIYEWAYGVFNGFPEFEAVPRAPSDFPPVLSKIAFMHLVKTTEGGVTVPEGFARRLERDRKFILDQIDIIAPDVVVGGLGDFELWGRIFGPGLDVKTTYGTRVFRHREMKVIDFYHPAYRISGAALYSLFQNVFRSKTFREL